MHSLFPLRKDVELDAGLSFKFFPDVEHEKGCRRAKSMLTYDRKILRKLMGLHFDKKEIMKIERSAEEDFNLHWFCDAYGLPVHIYAVKLPQVDLYDLYGEKRFSKTDVWRAFWEVKTKWLPLDISKAVVFPITGLSNHIIHDLSSLPPVPGCASIVIPPRDDRSNIIITPFSAFLAGLKKVWTP